MVIKVFQWIIVIIKALIIHIVGQLIIVSIDRNKFGLKLFTEIQKLQVKNPGNYRGLCDSLILNGNITLKVTSF